MALAHECPPRGTQCDAYAVETGSATNDKDSNATTNELRTAPRFDDFFFNLLIPDWLGATQYTRSSEVESFSRLKLSGPPITSRHFGGHEVVLR